MVAIPVQGATDAFAAQQTSIRDAEVENTIRAFATPVFQVAGLEPSAVHVYVLKDDTLNAFVAGGQNIFVNTGLLIKSTNASEVIGVLAHEVGHIAGGHLVRAQEEIRNVRTQQLITTLLGAAIGLGAKRGDVAGAVALGGQDAALREFLHYNRTQEYAADAAAMRFLDATGQSSEGLVQFMEVFEDQELLDPRYQDAYLRTHPMSRERLLALREHAAKSPFTNRPTPPEFVEMHARMKAKLFAFLNSPARTYRAYPPSDTSLAARYARAIADYRKPELEKAVSEIDALIAERPEDPYFQELKGQMLFENGHLSDALQPYEMAVRLLPDSGLLQLGLARVQLESNDPALLDSAIQHLHAALRTETTSSFVWRQLAIAYGRQGDMGMSALAMAEEAMLRKDKKAARYHAGKAETLLPKGSAALLKAQDILRVTDDKQDKDEKGKPGDRDDDRK